MVTSIKRLLVGNPLRTEQAAHERLSKKTALAVFSSDALSSTANQSSLLLKGSLLFKKSVVVVSVPYHLEH